MGSSFQGTSGLMLEFAVLLKSLFGVLVLSCFVWITVICQLASN